MAYFSCILEQSFSYFKYKKKQQLALIGLIGLLTFMVGVFVMVHENLYNYVIKTQKQETIILYWKHTSKDNIKKDIAYLKNIKGIKSIKIYTPQDALKILTETSNKNLKFDHEPQFNPISFTAVLLVDMKKKEFLSFIEKLQNMPYIKDIAYDIKKFDLAISVLKSYKYVALGCLGIFMCIIFSLVLSYYSILKLTRQKEINILYLVGSSKTFLTLPFVINAAVIGSISSSLGIGLVKLSQIYLNYILYTPPLWIKINFLSNKLIILLIIFIILVGMAGSYFAVKNIFKSNL
jgi:cell division transport system permease protein